MMICASLPSFDCIGVYPNSTYLLIQNVWGMIFKNYYPFWGTPLKCVRVPIWLYLVRCNYGQYPWWIIDGDSQQTRHGSSIPFEISFVTFLRLATLTPINSRAQPLFCERRAPEALATVPHCRHATTTLPAPIQPFVEHLWVVPHPFCPTASRADNRSRHAPLLKVEGEDSSSRTHSNTTPSSKTHTCEISPRTSTVP
jgi:hypothetical protein